MQATHNWALAFKEFEELRLPAIAGTSSTSRAPFGQSDDKSAEFSIKPISRAFMKAIIREPACSFFIAFFKWKLTVCWLKHRIEPISHDDLPRATQLKQTFSLSDKFFCT
jgi:hypothetical protein